MEAAAELQHWVWLLAQQPLTGERLAALGGKAATLMQLAALDYPVLPGLVLPWDAPGPPAPTSTGTSAADLPEPLRRELAQALPQLARRCRERLVPASLETGADGLRWAVRSSAAGEDSASASHAGQFHTCLGVASDQLEQAVRQVRQSVSNAALASYRNGLADGVAEEARPPAVLIQPMLAPSHAGVAFSADPLSGRRGVTLVQAVPGLADGLMAGREAGASWCLDRDGSLLEHRPAPAAGRQARPGADPPAELPLAQVRRIAALARQLGHHFGRPQDVEWALTPDGRLWLLQARPISTLRGLNDPDGRLALWDNSNIVESYSGVTTPLTFSFARKAYSEVYAQFCRFMGVPEPRIRRNRAVFGSMIGLLEGRIYYNLLNWYRVLALLPGYRLNSRFLEQMLGLKHQLPAAQMEQILRLQRADAAGESTPRWRDGLSLGRSALGLVANALSLGRRSRAFRRRLERVLLSPAELAALSDARPDELVSLYRRIEAELLSHWDAPLINDFYAMIVYGLLRELSRRWCPPEQANALHDWIGGETGVISAEPPRRIRAMARLALEHPGLIERLQVGTVASLQRELACLPALQQELERYLDDFGDRCLEELKLETLTLREDPLPLLRSIGAMAARLQAASRDPADTGSAAMAPPPAPPLLPKAPLRRWLLRWLQRRTRALVRNRENLRFERTRVFGLARRLLLELGRRLAELGLLDAAEDVLFLEVEEALAVIEGNGCSTDLRGLVAVRRASWQRQRMQPPLQRRLETVGLPGLACAALLSGPGSGLKTAMLHQATERSAAAGPSDGPDGSLTPARHGQHPRLGHWQGTGCAPGRVRARVSLVHDPRGWLDQPRHERQDCPILVAGSTDPGWVLLFPHAAGLLVERGSVLSHVAIVARELGLPMVTDLGGITDSLREGDCIEMDGRSGTVTRLESAAGP